MRERIASYQRRYVLTHPCLSYFVMFIGVPICLLLAVTLATTLISLPLSLLFHWI